MAETFNIFLIVMAVLAAGVYVALHFSKPDTAIFSTRKYGPRYPTRRAGS